MIETYTTQYTAQQRAPSSTQTRNNRPRNASIVSGAAGASIPQTNQTRKKPWWEKRREKQKAKRNQTRRNGPRRNGPNGSPVIPKL